MANIKVLIYSDCYTYGGSERLMIFLLQNKNINEKFDFVFAYRDHKSYTKGLLSDFKNLEANIKTYPLFILSNETLFYKINLLQLPLIIKSIIKLPFLLIQVSGLYFAFNSAKFFFFIKKIKPKIIHINNGGYPGALSCNHFVFAAKLNSLNSILYQVNNIAFKTKNYFNSFYDRFINNWVKYFITASTKAGDALINNRKFYKSKIVQIPNTILTEKITLKRDEILKNLKWDEDTFLLVQVAFLTNRKGQIYLIKALQQILQERIPGLSDKVKLILIGNGEDESVLRKYITENNLDNTVFFGGYRLDSANYINACDTFILPSIANEDMPLSLLTAMSLGKPVLATHFAGIAEVVIHKKNGLLIDSGTEFLSENLRASIVELYTNATVRAELGKNACITFNNNYSESIYAQKIISLYNLSLK